MWVRQALVLSRAAILESRKGIWPVEADSSSVPFKTFPLQSARDQVSKSPDPQPQLIGSHPGSRENSEVEATFRDTKN